MYTPDDFRDFPGAALVYKGELNDFFYDIQSKLVGQHN